MELKSIAKINLGLHVTGKLPNGYHLIETLFYPIPELFDILTLEQNGGVACTVEMHGLDEEVPLEKNLVWRAWDALRQAYPDRVQGVAVRVDKQIPAGAGLGGGSSNAGAVLRGLRTLFDLPASDGDLANIGKGLGADVPFFIYQRPLYATGISTDFEELPVNLAGFRVEVFPQPYHSPTPAAYQGLDLPRLQHSAPLRELLQQPIEAWKDEVKNDLETSVFKSLPELAAFKAELYAQGAVYACMTGSGSAVFGIFPDR